MGAQYQRSLNQSDVLTMVNQHFKLIETSGELKELRRQLNQFEKRMETTHERINDLWKATKLWFMIISMILIGVTLIINLIQYY